MKKFENRNFRLEFPEFLGIILMICLLFTSMFFYKSYNDVKELFNIEKTNIDYIIQAPSPEQVVEISSLEHIHKVVPYYYRSVNVNSGRNIATNLFIIDEARDIGYTTFSDSLLIDSKAVTGNALYATEDFVKNAQVKIGDEVSIIIGGTHVIFKIAGIYKSDYRNVGGSLLTVMERDVKNAVTSLKYSGAYVASNNLSTSSEYFLNEYSPKGDLRDREEFGSEEAYNIYLETRQQSDSTMKTFITAEYVQELTKRNESKLIHNVTFVVAMFVMAYAIILVIINVRALEYTRKNVLRDVRDNFTIEQENRMYHRYFSGVCILMVFVNIIIAISGMLFRWMNIVSIINIAGFCLSIIVLLVIGSIQKKKLKDKFQIEQKKFENEQYKVKKMER